MISLEEAEQKIIEEFENFDDWMDKYNYTSEENDKIIFTADSDAIITKGIINLLIRVLSNRTSKEIIDAPLNYIDKIGLKDHLSPTRSNGLLSMIKQMKMYAIAFQTKAMEK